MRLFIYILLICAVGCGSGDKPAEPNKAIIGTWKLMGMTKEPFPLDKITEADLIGGSMTFKEDKTFEGEVIYPKTQEKNLKVSGTYSVDGKTLIVNNQVNNSTTRSTLRFEGNFMIATPEAPGAFIAYYQRTK